MPETVRRHEPQAASRRVYHDGRLVPEEHALVSAHDRGLLYGDGLFETVRIYHGQPFALGRHIQRLFASLAVLRIDVPETAEELSAACRAVVAASGAAEGVLRLTVTRGVVTPVPGSDPRRVLGLPDAAAATRIAYVRPLAALDADLHGTGVPATIADEPFSRSAKLRGHKTLNYLDSLLAKQEAFARGAFEALWRDESGNLVEGASSNVFVVKDGFAATPPLSDGALPGVTRAICLQLLAEQGVECAERSVPVSDLSHADELLLTNTVVEVVPVTELDGVSIGNGAPGPVGRELLAAYRDLVALECGAES